MATSGLESAIAATEEEQRRGIFVDGGLELAYPLLGVGDLSGDVTDDEQINIFDLSLVGSHYDSTDPQTDLNGDGLVDIFDLSIAAGNYGLVSSVVSSE